MIKLCLRFEDGSTQTIAQELPINIGRCAESQIQIKAWRVAKNHAQLQARDAGVFINDNGALTGTIVNGMRISEYGPLTTNDEIIIGPCLINMISYDDNKSTSNGNAGAQPNKKSIEKNVLQEAETIDYKTDINGLLNAESGVNYEGDNTSTGAGAGAGSILHTNNDEDYYAKYQKRSKYRIHLHNQLLDALNLRKRDIATMSDDALRSEASRLLKDILANDDSLPKDYDHNELLIEVVNEAVGLGPLEPLLADTNITEIMVNRYDEIFVESGGKINRYKGGFSSEQAVQGVIDRIVSPLGRRIDESSPMVDARLKDGSRVNAVIPPISLKGSSITIRKFPSKRPTIHNLISIGALDLNMANFLQECVIQRKNIIVSGGTGSGKTTLLNILSNFIPISERIITIEDAAELQLSHEHLVSLESRPANLEDKGEVLIRDLVRNALRMRPDRIVVGECRGSEAFDMLAAMNTGHEGSLTTLHANSARDALARLETMILMAGMDLPLSAVREHVSSSIDIIVQQARLSTGQRVITSIVQITGQENGRIQLQELFKFEHKPKMAFIGCNVMPEKFDANESLNIEMFSQITNVANSSAAWQSS